MKRFAFVLACVAVPARADVWLDAEAPAAIPVSDVQAGLFRPGAMPAFGIYADRGPLAIGARLRAGILQNGPSPDDHAIDPGAGGLATAGVAVRLTLRGGLWLEGVAGGGITGRDAVPAFEAGLGWDVALDRFQLGPSARIVHVVGNGAMDTLGSADLVLIGLDVRFGERHIVQAAHVDEIDEPPPPAPPPSAVAPADRDHDAIVDRDTGCEQDLDGCPVGQIVVHDDRIVLDERVLFDTDRAHVKSAGRELIAQIVKLWADHPDWLHLTIEGHADLRGTDDYNLQLSQLRAERVRDVLVRDGMDAGRITPIGYGRTRPRDPGTSPEAHQRNRRVEFVIDRGPGASP